MMNGGETRNLWGDFNTYCVAVRPLTTKDGFRFHIPGGRGVILSRYPNGYILSAVITTLKSSKTKNLVWLTRYLSHHNTRRFPTFPEALLAAQTLNFVANMAVFIDLDLERELRDVR